MSPTNTQEVLPGRRERTPTDLMLDTPLLVKTEKFGSLPRQVLLNAELQELLPSLNHRAELSSWLMVVTKKPTVSTSMTRFT